MKLLHLFVSGILLAACTPLPDLEDDDDVRGPSESERPFEAPPNAQVEGARPTPSPTNTTAR